MAKGAKIGKTDFYVKLFSGVVRFREAASINEAKNRNGKVSYYAFIGYDDRGSTVKRSLGQDKNKAYAILAEINQRLVPWDRSNWTRRIQAWSGLFP